MLGTTNPAHQDDLTGRHISRANLQPYRHAPQFPLVELPPRSVRLTVIQLHPELGAQRLRKISSRSKDVGFVFPENGDDDDVVRRNLWREDESTVVPMRHDEAADEPRGHGPGRRPDVLLLIVAVQELYVERFGKVLPEEV